MIKVPRARAAVGVPLFDPGDGLVGFAEDAGKGDARLAVAPQADYARKVYRVPRTR
jgi:hypothetical protein